MDQPFANRVAVVTGAGGTLCSSLAVELARLGAAVAVMGRTPEKLGPVAETIRQAGGQALVTPADVTQLDQLEAANAQITKQLGPCDMLINGAGGNHLQAVTTDVKFNPAELDAPPDAGMDDFRGFFNLSLDRFASVLETNTMGTVIPSRVFGRRMAEEGKGVILNFASMNTYRPLTRVAAYAMSKAAIANFTMWLAQYLAPVGVRVNAIAPGFFVNDRSRKILMAEDGGLSPRGQQVMHHTPLDRFGLPEDLFGCARWLLDDSASAFVTGLTVPVDGGFLASAGV